MKVLILTCSYGEGHNSVSKAIEEELKERNISVQILDTSIWGNKFYSKIKLGLHANAAIKTPKLLNAIYKIGLFISNDKVKSPVYMKNAMSANSLKDYILEHEFDVVVSTHLFSMQTLSYLINRGFKIKSYGVITDYCYIPFIEETNLDYYFIPHKSLIKDFQRKGLPKRKLLGFGIPLKMNIREELSISEAKKRLNIKTDKKIITIMLGGLGCGDVLSICKNILQNSDYYVIVLAGSNKSLFKELNEKIKSPNFKVVPFTSKVNEYLTISDLVISKPGGISSTEIIYKEKPLILFEAHLGVEEYNRKFFEKNKLALYCKNKNEINLLIEKVFKNKFKFNFKYINKKSSQDIVDFVIKDYKKKD